MAVGWNADMPGYYPDINNNNYYKVVLAGTCQGQAITNVLWYRTGLDFFPGSMNLLGAEELAQGVYQQVWANANRMRTLQSTLYTLNDIHVMPMSELFAPLFSTPHVRSVNEAGLRGGSLSGPDLTYTVAFNLEPTSIFNGFFPPRKGHIKVGPCIEADVPDNGQFSTSHRDFVYQRMLGVAEDVVAPLPFVGSWFPIRVALRSTLLGTVLVGWADVDSIIVRPTRSALTKRRAES